MNFNFYEQFKDYPNVELLKIVQSPQDYQLAAVEAAAKILDDRTISVDEKAAVENEIQKKKNKDDLSRLRVAAYREKTLDILEPFVNPGTEVKPQKWLNIFLVVIAIQFTWILFTNLKDLTYFFGFVLECKKSGFSISYGPTTWWECFFKMFDINVCANIITTLYLPVTFFLLYKRKRWGWILLFADTIFVFIMSVAQIPLFYNHSSLYFTDSFLLSIAIRAVFAFFLWRKDITGLFKIDIKTKKATALVSALISLLFIACLEFVFH